jgi:hypothetical protein
MIAGRKFDCPGCGGSLEIRAAGYTTTVACRYCGSVIDVASPDATLIKQYHEAMADLAIPLGTRGTIAGVEWEAIGWQSRSAGQGQDKASWDEFLLFNPYAGYRWLVLDDGEWSFGRALESLPELGSDDVARWQGETWEVEDDPAEMVTTRVVGEFYWRVRVDETVTGRTFWSGNRQLSCEQNHNEVNWTALDPIDGDDVAKAFRLAADRPGDSGGGGFGRKGVSSGGGAQRLAGDQVPDDFATKPFMPPPFVRWTFVAALFAAALVFITLAVLGGHGKPATGALSVVAEGPERTITIGPIEAKRTWQAVTIDASAETFDNKWVELDYALVDRATHQAIETGDTVEHYSGTDSDGSWTEGSYSSSTLIARVPRGTYDLVVTASAHAWSSQPPETTPVNPWSLTPDGTIVLTFSASAGGVLWGNFVVVLILLFAPPIFFAWRKMKSASE